MSKQPLLQVNNISKLFGPTNALSDVTIEVGAGEIHSLLGRNGAGKSTLVNIIAGIYPPTEGDVLFEGQDIRSLNIFERQELGIRLVPQHENSFPELTVGENIFAGNLPTKHGSVDWKTINQIAEGQLQAYGLDVNPKSRVSELSSIDARKLNIIRAMYSGAKLIILDEPTTALTTQEREELFSFVLDLKARGTAFIFISHYLGEVIELSDQITVLRDGVAFPVDMAESLSEQQIAALVAGEGVELTRRSNKQDTTHETLVDIQCLSAENVEEVSLQIRKGEVLGIVGFPGAGAREFCRALVGLNPITCGQVMMASKQMNLGTPRKAIEQGITYISFDRHREGIVEVFDVNENIGISCHFGHLSGPIGTVDTREQRRKSEEYRETLRIKCNSIKESITALSGGNQQKVLVGRLLNINPKMVIMDEPTVGIDIKSREEIIGTILKKTEAGMSTLYLTNDYEELVRVADRLAFFNDGKLTALIDNDDITIEQLVKIRDQNNQHVIKE